MSITIFYADLDDHNILSNHVYNNVSELVYINGNISFKYINKHNIPRVYAGKLEDIIYFTCNV